MREKLTHLIETIHSTFDGSPWYGDSVIVKFELIKFEYVNKTVNGSNSIASLVNHLIQWRVFVIEKLKGNKAFDISLQTESDWPHTDLKNAEEWEVLIERLKQTQSEIVRLLASKDDAFLEEIAPGKGYTNLYMLEGIIHHDIYHLGQIGLINSELNQSRRQ